MWMYCTVGQGLTKVKFEWNSHVIQSPDLLYIIHITFLSHSVTIQSIFSLLINYVFTASTYIVSLYRVVESQVL